MAQGCEKTIPAELEIHTEPRPPERDPTLGIPVTVDRTSAPPHRLVTIGDSITQGFMSLAVFRTDLSWPAIVARELGIEATFSYPVYEGLDGPGGLPLDLERLARAIQTWAGPTLTWSDLPRTLTRLRSYMDDDRGLLGARLGRSAAPARPALPQPGRLRLGPARHAGAQRRPPATADRRRAGPGSADPPGGRERQRPGRARRGRAGPGRRRPGSHRAAGRGRPRGRRSGRPRHRDPGRGARRQQRARLGRPAGGVLEHGGLPRRAPRPAAEEQEAASPSGGPRTSRPSGPTWSPRSSGSTLDTSSWPPCRR